MVSLVVHLFVVHLVVHLVAHLAPWLIIPPSPSLSLSLISSLYCA